MGEGIFKEKIKEKVKKLGIEEKIVFLGFRNDVDKLLNCMDIFLFPSIYEGFGIAPIEAEANGLIIYCSNKVSKEIKISKCLKFFDLNEDIENIVEKICSEKIDLKERSNLSINKLKLKYDINIVCKELEQIYENI